MSQAQQIVERTFPANENGAPKDPVSFQIVRPAYGSVTLAENTKRSSQLNAATFVQSPPAAVAGSSVPQ